MRFGRIYHANLILLELQIFNPGMTGCSLRLTDALKVPKAIQGLAKVRWTIGQP